MDGCMDGLAPHFVFFSLRLCDGFICRLGLAYLFASLLLSGNSAVHREGLSCFWFLHLVLSLGTSSDGV
jgi:hypothetical protein